MLIVFLIVVLSITACGTPKDNEPESTEPLSTESLSTEPQLNESEVIKEVAGQCDHIASLVFDGTSTATTKSQYDINENIYTLYIINTNISSADMENSQWQGNGAIILNLETSLNSLCLSMKQTFDSSELKSEDYKVVIHFTDRDENIYFSSTNGVTSFSKWGR